jgi:hypothetical protein
MQSYVLDVSDNGKQYNWSFELWSAGLFTLWGYSRPTGFLLIMNAL